jgi:deoxyxylulose-5-phosphate synthase
MGMMLNNWSSFQCAKKRKGPRLVHVYTKKGKGFKPAEADPITYHAITKIAPVATAPAKKLPQNILMCLDNGYVIKLHRMIDF